MQDEGTMTTEPAASAPYVSTGQLPPAEHVRLLVNEAYERFRANTDGACLVCTHRSRPWTLTGSESVW
jgi:hypothetical protein